MKFNLTHAALGVAVLLVLAKMSKRQMAASASTSTNTAAASKPMAPTSTAGDWWQFAGWGG